LPSPDRVGKARMKHDRLADFDLLRQTARDASQLSLSFFGRAIAKEQKPDGSAVTEADKAVDALLVSRLRDTRPDYGWLSEESAEHENRLNARRVWVLDPIDGTRAFIQGRDDWTIALALVEDGNPVLSVVINPVRDEIFEAQAGLGAYLNGKRIFVSRQSALEGARLVVTGSALSSRRWSDPWPEVTSVWANSIIYRFALVASAQADACFALVPKWEWDVAAGALLVSEAGGVVSDRAGFPLKFNTQEAKVKGFLAAAPKLHQVLAERLTGALEATPATRRG
jgi:myo-inositol-1(or 4)-monophosphatase